MVSRSRDSHCHTLFIVPWGKYLLNNHPVNVKLWPRKVWPLKETLWHKSANLIRSVKSNDDWGLNQVSWKSQRDSRKGFSADRTAYDKFQWQEGTCLFDFFFFNSIPNFPKIIVSMVRKKSPTHKLKVCLIKNKYGQTLMYLGKWLMCLNS